MYFPSKIQKQIIIWTLIRQQKVLFFQLKKIDQKLISLQGVNAFSVKEFLFVQTVITIDHGTLNIDMCVSVHTNFYLWHLHTLMMTYTFTHIHHYYHM